MRTKRVRASEEFVNAYIECALWSSTDNADDSRGRAFKFKVQASKAE